MNKQNKSVNTRLPKIKLFQLSNCKSFSHFIKCRFSFFFSLARYSSILKIFLRCARKIIKLGEIDFCLQQRRMVCFAINMI